MANNLIGLVNQLQHMENSFTIFLMEAALKLSSLTEAKIFVLVETAEARRFGGKIREQLNYLYVERSS